MSVFPPGIRAFGGNAIETKSGGLPVEGALPPIQTSLEFQWMAWHPDEFGQRFNLHFVFKPVLPALVTKPILE